MCIRDSHQGMYDVLAIMEVVPIPFSVVAKKEVANIPFLKQIFSCVKAKMMDREDIRQSLQVIMQVAKEVKEGRNYIIFPEGTRSKNGNTVGEFKGGSFKACLLYTSEPRRQGNQGNAEAGRGLHPGTVRDIYA